VNFRMIRMLTAAGLLGLLCGCNSYRITQSSHFVNDDGFIVRVDYGRADKDHVNTFVSPVNGKTMDFRSKLVVDVTLPDGDSFTAWQCMNFVNLGTMYRTDNEKWMFLANGFTCGIFMKDENDPEKRYLEVYRGVLCNTPVKVAEKDDRWHKVKKTPKKYVAE